MAVETPKRPEEEIHGETERKPLFGPGSDDAKPAGNPNDPRSDKVATSEQLKKAEETGSQDTPHSEKSTNIDRVGRGYKKDDDGPVHIGRGVKGAFLNRLNGAKLLVQNNKKKTIGGVLGGSALAIVFANLSVFQGPLQIVHFAQNLQKYHFTSQYDASDDRYGKLARYVYHRKNGEVYKTNLGLFQNKLADKIAEKQKKAGIESEYNELQGFKERTKLDPKVFDGGSKSPEDLRNKIANRYPNSKPYIQDGFVYVDHENMDFRNNRGFERYMARTTGDSHIMGSVNGRVMSGRAGYILHPMKKLDRAALKNIESAYNDWRSKRKKTIGEGKPIDTTVENRNEDDPDSTEDDESSRQSEETTKNAKGGIDKFTSSKTFKGIGGLGAITGVGCMLKDLNEGYGGIKQEQVIEPSVRMGLDIMSTGAQIQSGDDFDIQQLDFLNKQLHGEDSRGKKSDYNQARSLLGEEGKKDKGVPESEALRSIGDNSPFDFMNTGGLKQAFDAACSTAGQLVTGIVGILGGPISAGVGETFSLLFSDDLQKLALDLIAGDAVDPLSAGADLGNVANYGARLAANSQATSNGGQPLSREDEEQLAMAQRQEDRVDFQRQPLFARMFDVYDSRSLISKVVDNSNSSVGQDLNNVASGIVDAPGYLFNIASAFTEKAAADPSVYDYGFPEVGYSASEMDDPSVRNPYKNAEDVVTKILPVDTGYIERAEKCFGVDIDPTTYEVSQSIDDTPEYQTVTEDSDCNDHSENWRKVRFFIFDSNISTTALCYEGDEDACGKINAGQQTSTTQSSDTNASGDVRIEKYDPPLSSPGGKINPKGITLHWWGFRGDKGIDSLADALKGNDSCGSGGCSVQFGITNDGKIYQMTKNETDLTYHAIGGNETTFGIEMEGGPEDFGRAGKEKYPKKFDAAVYLVNYLMKKYNISKNGSVDCGNVSGVHPHKAYNGCPGALHKDDIDDYYFNEIMKELN